MNIGKKDIATIAKMVDVCIVDKATMTDPDGGTNWIEADIADMKNYKALIEKILKNYDYDYLERRLEMLNKLLAKVEND